MSNRPYILLLFLISTLLEAQNYQTVEEINDNCAQLGFMGDEEAEIAVEEILSNVGLFKNFTIQECPGINNAVAKNIDVAPGHKERFILYDGSFFERIESKARNDWAAISILAHEIGHHLNGHALNNEGSKHKWELEADEFSGFVLARMGAELNDAQSAIRTLKYEKATFTHPAKADRLDAIATGWNRGSVRNGAGSDTDLQLDDIKDTKLKAQKVLYNYIDAIGGEDNILKIHTLKKKYSSTNKGQAGDNYDETYVISETFLRPNVFRMRIGDNEALINDDKRYFYSEEKNQWEFEDYADDIGVYSFMGKTSYIYEHSLLITNEDVTFLGQETIQGIECYAIQLPDRTEYIKEGDYSLLYIKTFYYSVESGLRLFEKEEITRMFKSTPESQRSKAIYQDAVRADSPVEHFTEYSAYQKIGGVKFPFVRRGRTTTSTGSSSSENKYKEIVINPVLDRDDFNPNKKS